MSTFDDTSFTFVEFTKRNKGVIRLPKDENGVMQEGARVVIRYGFDSTDQVGHVEAMRLIIKEFERLIPILESQGMK